MTCIAGVAHGGKVWIGGDSAGMNGWTLTVRADEKVFSNGQFLMGFTSSFRMGQLLRYSFEPPEKDPASDLDRYMVTTFIDGVRRCLKDGGYAEKKDEAERGGTFIVGIGGALYMVDNDYQVATASDGYIAIGCGREIALGSLYATKEWADQEKRVRTALEAAEAHNGGVRGPFVIRNT